MGSALNTVNRVFYTLVKYLIVDIWKIIKDEYTDTFRNDYSLELFMTTRVDLENRCIWATVFVKDPIIGPWYDQEDKERDDIDVEAVKIACTDDLFKVGKACKQLWLDILELDCLH
jgi:hypothetical protein